MLTLETGSGAANSNSFVSLEEVRAFAVARGLALPADDAVLEAKVILAHDYLLTIESQLQGYRYVTGQAMPFPRAGVVLYGRCTASNSIPQALKDAICQLVIEAQTVDLLPTATGRVVSEETVGPISTKYATSSTGLALPIFPKVSAFLAPLLGRVGLHSVRV